FRSPGIRSILFVLIIIGYCLGKVSLFALRFCYPKISHWIVVPGFERLVVPNGSLFCIEHQPITFGYLIQQSSFFGQFFFFGICFFIEIYGFIIPFVLKHIFCLFNEAIGALGLYGAICSDQDKAQEKRFQIFHSIWFYLNLNNQVPKITKYLSVLQTTQSKHRLRRKKLLSLLSLLLCEKQFSQFWHRPQLVINQ